MTSAYLQYGGRARLDCAPYVHTACCIACGCDACALRRCRVPAGACLASHRSVSWRSQVCGDIACGGRTGPLDCGYQKDVFSVPVIINMHTEMLPIEIGRGDALSKSGVELYTTRCVCGSMNVPAVGGVARLCASLCTAWWGAVNGPMEPRVPALAGGAGRGVSLQFCRACFVSCRLPGWPRAYASTCGHCCLVRVTVRCHASIDTVKTEKGNQWRIRDHGSMNGAPLTFLDCRPLHACCACVGP